MQYSTGTATGVWSEDYVTFNAVANQSSLMPFVLQTSYNYTIYADGVLAMAPQNSVASLFSMTHNYLWLGEYSLD